MKKLHFISINKSIHQNLNSISFSKKIKSFIILLILFISFFILEAYSYATTVSSNLAENIFRLHILANSDSEEDQNLKLKVRDAILEYMKTITTDISDKKSVIELSKQHTKDFKQIAEKVIKENGYDYSVNIEIGNFYFPTKYYGNISLPAGNYDALKIEIGNATRSKLVVFSFSTTLLCKRIFWYC